LVQNFNQLNHFILFILISSKNQSGVKFSVWGGTLPNPVVVSFLISLVIPMPVALCFNVFFSKERGRLYRYVFGLHKMIFWAIMKLNTHKNKTHLKN